jgi:acyl-CoA dehydrogenase
MSGSATSRPHEDLVPIVEGLNAFLRAEVIPRQDDERHRHLLSHEGRYDANGRFRPEVLSLMEEVRRASADAGFYNMLLPVEMGGAGLGYAAYYTIWESIYHECGGTYWLGYQAVAHWARGASHLLTRSSERIRKDVIPLLMSGERMMCFAMSEPDAGSDPWRMDTKAVRTEKGTWLLTGMKQWITNGPYADYALVFAVTDRELAQKRAGGISAFIVPTDTPGFAIDSVIRLFGESGGDEGIVSLTDVEVREDQIVGEMGDGFRLAISGVSEGRLYNSARAVGLSRWALEKAISYACDRETFGEKIINYQGVSFPLAERAMEVRAAHLLGLDCARRLDEGLPSRKELAMAKCYSTESAVRAIDTAMQTHGGMGFTNELSLFDAWVQARKICVADGTSQILRRDIAGALARGDIEL